MPKEVNLANTHPANESRYVVDMLFDRKIVTDTIPSLRIIVAEAYGNDAVLFGKFRHLSCPDPIIVHGAVYENEWHTRTFVAVGHLIAVDFNGFDAVRQCPRQRGLGQSDSRQSRERGSAGGQTQKFTAGKFHRVLSP